MTEGFVSDTQLARLSELRPHPRNYRQHPEDQIQHLIESIREHGVYRPIIATADGTILAGHGVHEAAQRLRMDEVPVVYIDLHPHDPRALKLLVGDNEITNLAEDNDKVLAALLQDIQEGDQAGLLGTGYDDEMLANLMAGGGAGAGAGGGEDGDAEHPYTMKVDTPLYEPSEPDPPLFDQMMSTYQRDKLRAEILEAEGISEDARAFLLEAANRHVVYNYKYIAEFYAHAEPEVQRLMEASALVIIDFDQAIDRGYARLRDSILAMIEQGVDVD